MSIAAGGRRSLAGTSTGNLMEWGGEDSTPRIVGGSLAMPMVGGEAGTDRLGYNFDFQKSWYGYDTQGNVRFLTDPNGSLTDRYTYDAFGNLIDRSGTTDNEYLYQGERFDPTTGLYHLRAREYDPRLGRFQQQDDFDGFLGQPFSHNRYAYAEADPVNKHDPSGKFATSIVEAMHDLYQYDEYLSHLASIGPSERTIDLEDWLADPLKASLGVRPTIVNRERSVWVQSTSEGAVVGSLEQESGAINGLYNPFTGTFRSDLQRATYGLGAGSDVYFNYRSSSAVRPSVVERMVDSAWGATRRLWPQLNTGPKLPTDPHLGLSTRLQNRWSDVVYHDAILQAALRGALVPGVEIEGVFTRTLGGRKFVPTRSAATNRALRELHLADGGLRMWRVPPAHETEEMFKSTVSGPSFEIGSVEEWALFDGARRSSLAYRAGFRIANTANAAASLLQIAYGGVQIAGGLTTAPTGVGAVAAVSGAYLVFNGVDNFTTSAASLYYGEQGTTATHDFLTGTLKLDPETANFVELGSVVGAGVTAELASFAQAAVRAESLAASRTERLANAWIEHADRIASTPFGQLEFPFASGLPSGSRTVAGEQLLLDFDTPTAGRQLEFAFESAAERLPTLPEGYHYRHIGGKPQVVRNPGRAVDLPAMHLENGNLRLGPSPNAIRSEATRAVFLRQQASNPNAPRWMKPYLEKGELPPGYTVHHKKALFDGGTDTLDNMVLQGVDLHINTHRFYRPGGRVPSINPPSPNSGY